MKTSLTSQWWGTKMAEELEVGDWHPVDHVLVGFVIQVRPDHRHQHTGQQGHREFLKDVDQAAFIRFAHDPFTCSSGLKSVA